MNKMLVAIFDTETAAHAGRQALRRLHADGDITLYATGIVMRDAAGLVVMDPMNPRAGDGVLVGLGVGSLIGMLAGPAGLAVGAVTGSVAGALRDFWAAGVGLDFVEEATRHLQPGRVALVAEIEEEWVIPVDTAMEAAGGLVFRRSRNAVFEAQADHDVAALKAEIVSLEAEAGQAAGDARARLQDSIRRARNSLDVAVRHTEQRVETLAQEAEAKTAALQAQLTDTGEGMRSRIEDRLQRVKTGYLARGAKLSQAWALAKDALAA